MPHTPHVAVIGGGAIGLSAAYYLRREGASVTVLDKGSIGHGCSLNNAGYLCPSHFVPLAHPGVITQGMKWLLDPESPFYIRPRLSPELASWVWRFYRASTTEHNVHKTMTLLRDLCTESLRLFGDLARVVGPLAIVLLSVFVFSLVLKPFGLLLSTAFLVITVSKASHEFRWRETLVNAAVLVVIVLLVFVYFLKFQIPVWPAFIAG